MKSVILAAGRGSRINEITHEQPKCMIEFNKKPLLYWQCDALQNFTKEVIIVTGYKCEMIESYSQKLEKTKIIKNEKWNSSNMLYSLMCAKKIITKESVIISYADIFYSKRVIKKLFESNDDIVIAYDPNWLNLWEKRFIDPLDDAETFKIDQFSYLNEIGKKPKQIVDCEGQFMGLLKITECGWSKIERIIADLEPKIKEIDTTFFLNYLIEEKIKIKAIPIDETWGEVDTYHDLKLYKKLLQTNYFSWMK